MLHTRYVAVVIVLSIFCLLPIQAIQARPSQSNEALVLASPDGAIEVNFTIKEKLEPYPSGLRLYYAVSYRGRKVVLDSPLGLDFQEMAPLARDLVVQQTSRRTVNERWAPVVPSKRSSVVDNFNELRIDLREAHSPHRSLGLVCRAYDDGIAFRYVLPEQPGVDEFRLTSERTQFHFAGNHTVWAADYKEFVSYHEAEFRESPLNQISPGAVIEPPLLVRVAEDVWVAVAEANLRDWAGMYLTGMGAIPNVLVTTLSPRRDEPGVLVRGKVPHQSPWRLLMIGQRPGDLIESDIVMNLSEPSALEDPSWITPGKSAWDHWWSNYAPDANFKVGVNTETIKYFTEFASEMGFEYVLVDGQWYAPLVDPTLEIPTEWREEIQASRIAGMTLYANADITRAVPELDMPEVIRYAKERNVKVMLWLHWRHVDGQMEEAFPLYEKWGIAGVKIDFMTHNDQEMVNWYPRVLKKAAEHHLVVNFHTAYRPTGLRRTYPNLLTCEDVLGNEHNKFSGRITPEHTVTVPFTRMLTGPMDFTPGGFRHATPERFRAQRSAPFVMGTRMHQLAMMVVYESPLQVLCDSPFNYRGQAGLEFLRAVPTVWDETKVLEGSVGDFIVIARRRGDTWFLGGMSDEESRTLDVSLAFLGAGPYVAHIFADAPDAGDYPDRVKEERRTVTSEDKLAITMAPAGGYAAILSAAR